MFLLVSGNHALLPPGREGPWLRRLGVTDGSGPAARRIEAGCGAVTLESNNAKPKETIEPRPSAHIQARPAHVFLNKYRLKNMMINWEGVPVEFTAEEQRKMIERIKPIAREHDCRLIANMHPDPWAPTFRSSPWTM